ncbi:acyltransferase [Novosphingobium sp. PC22D]|uniref:acyltransferase n=1 Tax=Novosphingobium sp. PC22D TaxID=1962403 RepID=UPI001981FAD2|nr:acyltransferase [Novosphingobium sp. PC22D]
MKRSLATRILRKVRRDLRYYGLRAHTVWFAATRGVKVGKGTLIFPGARMSKIGGGTIRIGSYCVFHHGSLLATYGGDIHISDRVSLNDYSILYGHGGLEVGEGARIAAHTVVIPSNHGIDADEPIWMQPMALRGIVIGKDVWMGTGVRVLDGSVIADGCVIAAGAVVLPTLQTEPMGIYGGVPARKISSRIRSQDPS